MAQFAVHRNKGVLRDRFLVWWLSGQFDRYRRRVLVPLARQTLVPQEALTVDARMNPTFLARKLQAVVRQGGSGWKRACKKATNSLTRADTP